MKVLVVWASNGENYEDNYQNIWAICSSKEAAEQCITNAHEQIRHDEERWNELARITSDPDCVTSEIEVEMDHIDSRRYSVPYRGNNGLPYFSIREYDIMN